MLKNIKEYVKTKKENLKSNSTLAIIQIGNNEASNRYVKNKIKDCEEVGIPVYLLKASESINQQQLEEMVRMADRVASAIIVQLPLPAHLDKNAILDLIPREKDVDGFRADSPYKPCTPKGIMDYLADCGLSDLSGKNVTIIGRSDIVGKPLAMMMLEANATVTICHSKTKDLYPHIMDADIIVCAVGRENFLDCSSLSEDVIIIDVGINIDKNGKLVGDCCNTQGKQVTPVPGGVGLLTRLALLDNIKEGMKNYDK